MEESASQPPASASAATATAKVVLKPNATIDKPQPMTAITVARPEEVTLDTRSERSPARSAPIAGAAKRNPTVLSSPPRMETPHSGNSALGIPKTMAVRSIRKIPCRGWEARRNRNPSPIDRSPGRGTASGRQQWPHHDQGHQRHRAGAGIDPVCRRQCGSGDHYPTERRSNRRRQLIHENLKCEPRRQAGGAHDPGDRRAPSGRVDRRPEREQRDTSMLRTE